ncbi:MAG: ATP/GTP-binding protein [Thiotrichaceae bacterium]|nr:ATP/GTP-binding protein [Thiotrichaceae bacterium]
MSQINRKIIFTGPVGSGKTTAINSISDIDIVSTNKTATDMTKDRKRNTTVAMDYGIIKLGNDEKVHLYGTPGQQRFDFMWSILSKGGIGLVLLLDNTRKDPFHDMRFYINSFKEFIETHQLVIGITQIDKQRPPHLDDYQNWLDQLGYKAPIFEVDARSREDVSLLLQGLLLSLDPGISE